MKNDTSNPTGFQKHFPFFYRVFTALLSRRFLKAGGFALLGLITLVALFYAIENWRGAREWKKVKAELQAAGEPLSFAELVPPMPQDEDNFAMAPFFDGFFDKSTDPGSGKPVWQLRTVESNLPDWPGNTKDESTWHLAQKFVFNRELFPTNWTDVNGVSLETNSMVEVVRLLFEQARQTLDEIEVEVRRPRSQFPIHFEDNASALLPHLAKLKALGRMFALRALFHLETNNVDAALTDVETALRLAESIKDEPILISGLVQIAILNLALQPVWQGLSNGQWASGQLAGLQAQLEPIDVLAGYRSGMRGERIFGMDLSDIFERERNLDVIGSPDGGVGSYFKLLGQVAPKGWFTYNKAVIARLHTDYTLKAIDVSSRRYDSRKAHEYGREVAAEVEGNWRLFIAKMVLPAVDKAVIRFTLAQTDIDMAALACALERFKLKEGEYPAELGSIVPEFIKSLPHDIMDGQPLRYRRNGGGFVLYSVGANEVDNGGIPGFKEDSRGKHWLRDEGDWVWKYPADAAKP